MSIGVVGNWRRCLGATALLWLALPVASWAQSCTTCNTGGAACGQNCQMFHCPPFYKHCQEGPPRICFKCACPHPISNPCMLPHWGYYQTCWTPFPFPPDWTHCPTPPPAAYVNLNPVPNGTMAVPTLQAPNPLPAPSRATPTYPSTAPRNNGSSDLPAPRRLEGYQPGL